MRAARIGAVVVTVLMIALIVALWAMRPHMFDPLLQVLGLQPTQAAQPVEGGAGAQVAAGEGGDSGQDGLFAGLYDTALTDEELTAQQAEWLVNHRTPLIARYDGVDLRCPIWPSELTGVLFHQASYDYALVLETKLPEADYEKAASARKIRVNAEQATGGDDEWLDADALHVWRVGDTTPMDTSIDVGALPGTVVRSPVTGTVVLVKDYKLYDEVPDIEIHIQPQGRDDLDCVLLHTTDPLVQAGDAVVAGVTELSHVRDIQKDLYDVQLYYFTPEGVGGNHTHVQLNDANAKGYRKTKLKGAIKVGEQDVSGEGASVGEDRASGEDAAQSEGTAQSGNAPAAQDVAAKE